MRALFVLVFFPAGVVYANHNTATSWLIAQQNQNGSWCYEADGEESQIYCTSIVLQALQTEEIVDNKSLQWIRTKYPTDTAALAKALQISGDSRFKDKLLQSQNLDGGWGKKIGWKSTPWYTSNAIIALLVSDEHATISGGKYLLVTQTKSGSWSNSSLITSNCIFALSLLYNYTRDETYLLSAIDGARWLEKNINEDVYSLSNSIIAYKSLYSLLRDESLSYVKIQEKLLEIQNVEGYWGQTPREAALSTAWALIALNSNLILNPVEPRLTLTLSAKKYAIQGGGTEIEIIVENVGLRDIKNLELSTKIRGLEKKHTINYLKQGERNYSTIKFSLPTAIEEGNYTFTVKGVYTAVDSSKNFSITNETEIIILKNPLRIEVYPKKLKTQISQTFSIILENIGENDIIIRNATIVLDENWGEVKVHPTKAILHPREEGSYGTFEVITPQAIGEYPAQIILDINHPLLGETRLSSYETFIVGSLIPSVLLKLILYSTWTLSGVLILNLLLGLDILE
jgi:hypothetical protein